MGVRISARKLVEIGVKTIQYNDEVIVLYNIVPYRNSHSLYEDVYCKTETVESFGSIPYSMYNAFRETIGQMFVPDFNFKKDDYLENLPFAKLINFADNEGHIKQEVCEEIYKDFEKYETKYIQYIHENPYVYYRFGQYYLELKNVFEKGSQPDHIVYFS